MIEGWKVVQLGDEIDFLTGFPFSSEKYTDNVNDIKLLRGDNIIQGRFRWDDVKTWNKNDATNYANYALQVNDIVVAMDRPWVSAGLKYAIVSQVDLPCLLVQRVARLRSKGNLDNKYLAQIIASQSFSDYLLSLQSGSTVPHISGNQIRTYSFYLPPLPEQRKIAAILSTWDEAITLTEQLIAALQRRKQALMQLLLTGAVRFQEFIQSDEFQETEFGNIPADWELHSLSDFVEEYRGGSPLAPEDFVEEGFDVIPKKAISGGGWLNIPANNPPYCRWDFAREYSNSIIDNRYLITTLRDLVPTGPSIGYIVKFTEDKKYILSQGVYGFIVNGQLDKDFLIQLSNTKFYRRTMQSIMVGSTQVHIRTGEYFSLQIPIPPIEEQHKIAAVLTLLDDAITQTKHLRNIYETQKRGLMQPLLTGAVRVQVDE